MKKNEQITRRQFLKGALAGTAGLAVMGVLGPGVFAKASQIVDPAISNEVHVVSDTPYVMSGNQTYFVADKILSSGYSMPVIGIGTYALSVDVAENSVYSALKCGYHLVDTARAYWNEEGVGRGIKRALDEGLIKIFMDAGFCVTNPTCGACLGMSNGILAPGEVCASTTNRNFNGRMGKGGMVHLMSPATAAATALAGHITNSPLWKK